jgi:hypothetical protein
VKTKETELLLAEQQKPIQLENFGQNKTTANSTYPKGGVSSSIDSFVVKQTLVFQIKFCGKSPALRVAAKR